MDRAEAKFVRQLDFLHIVKNPDFTIATPPSASLKDFFPGSILAAIQVLGRTYIPGYSIDDLDRLVWAID